MHASNFLDVLAAAGAARLTGQRFGFGPPAQMPAIDEAHAARLRDALQSADLTPLRMSAMDLLRGAGQMPTLDVRARKIAASIAIADVVNWLSPIDAPRVSLRWEIGNPSDTPAAHRWQGSTPVDRLSHPGRNALALYAIADLPPLFLAMFQTPPGGAAKDPSQWPFGRARRWYAPRVPVSYEMWLSIQRTGPPNDDGRYPQSAIPTAADSGQWWIADVVTNGKMLSLSQSRTIREPTIA